ncbi:MAG: hypothetical protein JO112_11655 [Planctomycetes bacterium]|nr:hypothetical protein [Planctomycetota bacterium]
MKKLTTHTKFLPLQPRIQWNENSGYCGETSFITAGLSYGQYLSQYDARGMASPGLAQTDGHSQLLLGPGYLGDNDVTAAKAMLLKPWPYDFSTQQDTGAFLAWVKGQVVRGFPVAIGVLMNAHLFPLDPEKGDDEYDHIVPVYGIGSNNPLSDPGYYPDDVIYFYDNWVYRPKGDAVNYFHYTFQDFQGTRKEANAGTNRPYWLVKKKDGVFNYGIALQGLQSDQPTLPVQITTAPDFECPEMKNTGVRPDPELLQLFITVSGLVPGVSYKLYRYNSFTDVPKSHINESASQAVKSWSIQIASGTTWSLAETILSSEVAVYRAVEASAP